MDVNQRINLKNNIEQDSFLRQKVIKVLGSDKFSNLDNILKSAEDYNEFKNATLVDDSTIDNENLHPLTNIGLLRSKFVDLEKLVLKEVSIRDSVEKQVGAGSIAKFQNVIKYSEGNRFIDENINENIHLYHSIRNIGVKCILERLKLVYSNPRMAPVLTSATDDKEYQNAVNNLTYLVTVEWKLKVVKAESLHFDLEFLKILLTRWQENPNIQKYQKKKENNNKDKEDLKNPINAVNKDEIQLKKEMDDTLLNTKLNSSSNKRDNLEIENETNIDKKCLVESLNNGVVSSNIASVNSTCTESENIIKTDYSKVDSTSRRISKGSIQKFRNGYMSDGQDDPDDPDAPDEMESHDHDEIQNTKNTLISAMQLKTPSKEEYICTVCQKEFLNESFYNKHLIGVHLNSQMEKELIGKNDKNCSFCDKEFSKKQDLLYHVGIVHHTKNLEKFVLGVTDKPEPVDFNENIKTQNILITEKQENKLNSRRIPLMPFRPSFSVKFAKPMRAKTAPCIAKVMLFQDEAQRSLNKLCKLCKKDFHSEDFNTHMVMIHYRKILLQKLKEKQINLKSENLTCPVSLCLKISQDEEEFLLHFVKDHNKGSESRDDFSSELPEIDFIQPKITEECGETDSSEGFDSTFIRVFDVSSDYIFKAEIDEDDPITEDDPLKDVENEECLTETLDEEFNKDFESLTVQSIKDIESFDEELSKGLETLNEELGKSLETLYDEPNKDHENLDEDSSKGLNTLDEDLSKGLGSLDEKPSRNLETIDKLETLNEESCKGLKTLDEEPSKDLKTLDKESINTNKTGVKRKYRKEHKSMREKFGKVDREKLKGVFKKHGLKLQEDYSKNDKKLQDEKIFQEESNNDYHSFPQKSINDVNQAENDHSKAQAVVDNLQVPVIKTIINPNLQKDLQNPESPDITDENVCNVCNYKSKESLNSHRNSLGHKFKVIRKYSKLQINKSESLENRTVRVCNLCQEEFQEEMIFSHLESIHTLSYMKILGDKLSITPKLESASTLMTPQIESSTGTLNLKPKKVKESTNITLKPTPEQQNPTIKFTMESKIKEVRPTIIKPTPQLSQAVIKPSPTPIAEQPEEPDWFMIFRQFCEERKSMPGIDEFIQSHFIVCNASTLEYFLNTILSKLENISILDKIVSDIGSKILNFREDQFLSTSNIYSKQNIENLRIVQRFLLVGEYGKFCEMKGFAIKSCDPIHIVIFLSQLVERRRVSKEDIEWTVITISKMHRGVNGMPLQANREIKDFLDAINSFLSTTKSQNIMRKESQNDQRKSENLALTRKTKSIIGKESRKAENGAITHEAKNIVRKESQNNILLPIECQKANLVPKVNLKKLRLPSHTNLAEYTIQNFDTTPNQPLQKLLTKDAFKKGEKSTIESKSKASKNLTQTEINTNNGAANKDKIQSNNRKRLYENDDCLDIQNPNKKVNISKDFGVFQVHTTDPVQVPKSGTADEAEDIIILEENMTLKREVQKIPEDNSDIVILEETVPIKKEVAKDVYFCLECEGCNEIPTCSHLHHPRRPLGFDIAGHFLETGHLDGIRPIGKFMRLKPLSDLAHSTRWAPAIKAELKLISGQSICT